MLPLSLANLWHVLAFQGWVTCMIAAYCYRQILSSSTQFLTAKPSNSIPTMMLVLQLVESNCCHIIMCTSIMLNLQKHYIEHELAHDLQYKSGKSTILLALCQGYELLWLLHAATLLPSGVWVLIFIYLGICCFHDSKTLTPYATAFLVQYK